VCRERFGVGVLGFAHRGFDRVVTTFEDKPIAESGCHVCDECIEVCPVGALVFKEGKKGSAACAEKRVKTTS
jgi:formate dehydrogenase major subunit/NADH-quinone oxidoreductase subunit G